MRDPSRFDELLADRLLEALSPEDATELEALLASGDPPADARRAEELEEALALAAIAGCVTGKTSLGRPPSDALLGRLQVDAAAWARQQRASLAPPAMRTTTAPPSLRAPPSARQAEAAVLGRAQTRSRVVVGIAVLGWVAAAALGVLALRTEAPATPKVVTITVPEKTPPTPPSPALAPAEEREALLARGATVVRMDWSATKDPAAAGVTGDVVWSAADNKGFMRFRGLAVNDRAKLQYQLWIFDKTRDQRHPIDGGVFDVDAATGDVIVPIRAKLDVREATLFAITIEQPGGVVVSSRKRLVLAAKVPPALRPARLPPLAHVVERRLRVGDAEMGTRKLRGDRGVVAENARQRATSKRCPHLPPVAVSIRLPSSCKPRPTSCTPPSPTARSSCAGSLRGR